MSKRIQLHLWVMDPGEKYRDMGSVAGRDLPEAVIEYSKIAKRLGFTIYRNDADFGYYENDQGSKLFARVYKSKGK